MQSELEKTQDRLRAAEVVIMALYHRIDKLEGLIRDLRPFDTVVENRELKYDSEGLRLVIKDSKEWR